MLFSSKLKSEKMLINLMKGKIHRATVTEANLDYEGSITIDLALMDAAGIHVGERVQIVNVNNGERFETYTIPSLAGSGEICLNGPAARRVQVGDVIIIISYGWLEEKKVDQFKPKVVHVNSENKIVEPIHQV